jgi:HK97 family phage major capsid protein
MPAGVTAGTVTLPELTREQVQAILVRPLEAASVFLAAGPRIFDTDGSPVRVPRLVGMDEPDWIGENELITEVEADTDEVLLLPNGLKSVKSITRYSNELARQSVVALDAALRDKMVRDAAAKIDTAFIAGTGDFDALGQRTTPLGLINFPGTQAITGVGDLTLDHFLDAIGVLLAANVDPSRCRVFMRSETFVGARKLKDNDGKYLLQPDPTADALFRIQGLPVTITNRIPAEGEMGAATTSVLLADFSQVAVARDLNPSVKILTERYADFDQQAIRVVARMDAAPLNEEAVVVLRGVNLPEAA